MNKEEFKKKFPNWVFEDGDFTLCLSDDIDSLVSSTVIRNAKGWCIEHFYDFHKLYSTDKDDKRKAVAVDIAINKGMAFDNHTVRLSDNCTPNLLSANPNIAENVSRINYTSKYALSTALLVYFLYDIPLPSTDDGKMMLMAIDSSMLGYYKGFKKQQVGWLEKMGMEEMIYLQERHTLMDFIEVKRRFKSSEKIFLDDNGYLQTEMQLEGISDLLEMEIVLPNKQFDIRKEFTRSSIKLNPNKDYSNTMAHNQYKPFSMALTSKNVLQLTY